MTETSSFEPKRRRRWVDKPLIPNEEIRWFICSVASVLREKGGYSDGYSSHGEPDTLPFSAKELGIMGERGNGIIERAGECYKAWGAIGGEHREVLAAYYGSRRIGEVDPSGRDGVVEALIGQATEAVVSSMQLTAAVAKAARGNMEIAGVMKLLSITSEKHLADRANAAIRVAHSIWELERERLVKPSDVKWKTGDILCPDCQRDVPPGLRFCECGHEFWSLAELNGGLE